MGYQFDFDFLNGSAETLLRGLKVTLELAVAANVMGLVLGFILCLLVMSRWQFVRWPAQLFIEFFRCTPALLQIVWFFYCIPMMVDVFIDPVVMGVLALGLNLTAFNAEAYRAGVQAVPKEHLDACVALGLKPWQRTFFVVLPQALRSALPVLMTNGIGTLQQSALVAIVAVADLMYVAKSLATEAYRPLETYSVVALIYFALSLPISRLVHVIERRQDAAVQR
ncbi:amino acid ABC transporter permease [Burkholderia sp. KK1]|uniref:Polar amino acid ABC transporter inner membrane subunit n=1 Tax=Caballeronia cordobensis TaxID=1353886 RepID=A0A158HM16_CABCO|nr:MULTISPECIES: amino acid ABC transporter permease [Caballeronia]AET92709.1 polar amino acid ABC transporter, inner membrane subunit [Burkholderia sp. YI23]AQH02576.1 amino acid ABC transporter permease [Burkholderia sp. KK1]BBQ00159.1 ABC transporter permease [Burkholderia sp. SFA1]MCE4574774.1 amino acid ABC transporter permease [Caballeronia sp. CLC5]SAL45448.1 polar amino acid ABC transporter inner membrane subunit [Caballeronia cordobensis]